MWGNISQLVKNSLNQESDGESNPSTPERSNTRDRRRDNNSILEGLQIQLAEAEDRNKSINEEFKKILKNKEREIKQLRSENESLSISRISDTSHEITDSAVENNEDNGNDTTHNRTLSEDLAKLQRKIEEYEILISQKDSTLQTALAQMKEAEDLKDKVEEQERKNTEKLMHELAGRIKAHETVQRKMEEMKHVLEEKDNAVRNMADQLAAQDDLLKSRQDAIKKLKRINAGSEATEDMITTLQSEILRKDKALTDLQEQLDKAVTGQKLLESSISNRDELGSSKDKTIETLWAEIHQKDELIKKLSTSKDTHVEDLEQKSEQMKAKMMQLQNENDEFTSTIDTLERKLEQSNNKLLKSSGDLGERLKSVEDELKIKNEMLTSKEQAISMIHKDLDEKASENQKLLREVSTLKSNLETAKSEREERDQKFTKEHADKVELSSKLESLSEEKDDLLKQLEHIQQQLSENVASNKESLDTSQALIEAEQQENQNLKDQHIQLNSVIKNLESELEQKQLDISSKDEVILQNDKDLSEIKEMLESLKVENANLKSHVDEKTREKDALADELDTTSNGQLSLKSSVLELTERLAATEQELSSSNIKCAELATLNQELEQTSAAYISERDGILQKQMEMEQALEEFVRATELRKRKSGRSSAEGPSRVQTPSDEHAGNSSTPGSPSKTLLLNVGELLSKSEDHLKAAVESKTFADIFRVLEEERCAMEDKLDAVIQERNELCRQSSQLDDQMLVEREKSEQLNLQLENDKSTIEKMKLSVEQYEEQLRLINETMEQGQKALSEATNEKFKLEGHVASLQATMEDKIKELSDINADSTSLCDSLNKQLETLQMQNDDLSNQLTAVKQEVHEKSAENEALQKSIAALEESLATCTSQLNEKKDENSSLQSQFKILETEQQEQLQRFEEITTIKAELENTVDSLSKELKDKDALLSDSSAKLQQTLNLLEQIESRNASMDERISSLDAEVNTYEAKLREAKETVEAKEEENRELNSKLMSTTDELDSAVKDKDSLKAKVDDLSDVLSVKEQQCSDLDSKLDLVERDAEEKIERSKKLLEEYESLIADKDQSTGNLMESNRREVEEISEEVHKLRLELQETASKAESDAREWNDERCKMDLLIQKTNTKHKDCVNTLAVSQDNLSTIEMKYVELKSAKEHMETDLHEKIDELEASCNRSRDQCDALQMEVNELRQSMELKVSELEHTKERLVDAEKSNEAVNKELRDVTDTLEKCKDSLLAKEALIAEYTERCEQLGIELSSVADSKTVNEQTLHNTLELLSESKQRISILEEREKQLIDSESSMKDELEQTVASLNDITCQARNGEELLSELKQQLQSAGNEIQALSLERDECKEISIRRLEELHESAKQIDEERCRNEESAVILGDLRHQLKCYEEKVSHDASESDTIISAKSEIIAKLEFEAHENHNQLKSMEKETAIINLELQDTKVSLESSKQEISQLKEALNATENENVSKLTISQLKVGELEECVSEHLSVIGRLESTIEELQAALIAKDQKLFSEVQDKEEMNNKSRQIQIDLDTSLSNLNDKLSELEVAQLRIHELEETIADREAQADDLQKILEKSIREDQDQIDELKRELRNCEAQIKDLQSEIDHSYQMIEQLNRELSTEKDSNESNKQKVTKLAEELQQNENQLNNKEAEVLKLQETIKDLVVSLDSQKVELSVMQCKSESDLNQSLDEVNHSKTLISELQAEIRSLSSAKEEKSVECQQLQTKLEKKVKVFEELKAKATLKVKSLKDEVANLSNELHELKSKYNTLQEQYNAVEKSNCIKLTDLQESLSVVTKERQELTKQNEEQAEQLSSLLSATDTLKTMDGLNKDLLASKAELVELKEKLENELIDVKNEKQELAEQCNELRKQCLDSSNFASEIEVLKTALANVKKEQDDYIFCIENQKKEIMQLSQDVNLKEERITLVESENSKLLTKISDQSEEGNAVREMLQEALNQVQSSQGDIAMRDKEIETLKEGRIDSNVIQELENKIEQLTSEVDRSNETELALQQSLSVEITNRSNLEEDLQNRISDNEVLRTKVAELEAAASDVNTTISELHEKAHSLAKSKGEMEVLLQDSDQLNKSLLDDNESKAKELVALNVALSNANKKKEDLEQLVANNQSLLLENQNLSLELDDSRQLIQQLDEMKERLRSAMADKSILEEKTVTAQSLLTDSNSLVKTLQLEVDALKSDMESRIQTVSESSEKEQQQLKLKCAKLIKKCQGLKTENESNQKVNHELKENLHKIGLELTKAEEGITVLEEKQKIDNLEIEALKSSICDKNNDIENMEHELAAANSKILELSQSLNQSRDEQQNMSECTGQQMITLQSMVNQLEAELQSRSKPALVSETPFQIDDGQIMVASAPMVEHSPVNEILCSSDAEAATMTEPMVEANGSDSLTHVESLLESKEAELSELNASLTKVSSNFDKARKRIAMMKKVELKISEENASLQRELELNKSKIERLLMDYEAAKCEANDLKSNKNHLELRIAELMELFNKVDAEKNALKCDFDSISNEIDSLKNLKLNTEEELERTKLSLQYSEEKCQLLGSEVERLESLTATQNEHFEKLKEGIIAEEAKIAKKETAMVDMLESMESLREESVSEIEQQLNQSINENQHLKNIVTEQGKAMEILRDEMKHATTVKQTIESLNVSVEDLQKDKLKLQEECESRQSKIEALEWDLDVSRENNQTESPPGEEIELIKKQLEEVNSDRDNLTQALKDAKIEMTNHTKEHQMQLENLRAEVTNDIEANYTDTINKLEEQKQSLLEQIKTTELESESKLADITLELEKSREELTKQSLANEKDVKVENDKNPLVEQLQNELMTKQASLEQEEKGIELLKQEISDMKSHKDEIIRKLKIKVKQVMKDRDLIRENLQTEIERLTQEKDLIFNEVQANSQSKEDKLRNTELQLIQSQAEVEEAKATIDDRDKEIVDLKEALNGSDEDSNEREKLLEAKLEEKCAELDKYRWDASDTEMKIYHLEQRLGAIITDKEEIDEQLRLANESVEVKDDIIAKLKGQLSITHEDSTASIASEKTIGEDVSHQQKVIDDLRSVVDLLTASNRSINSELIEKTECIDTICYAFEEDYDSDLAQKLITQHQNLENEVVSLKQLLERKKSVELKKVPLEDYANCDITDLAQRLQESEAECQQLETTVEDMEATVKELEATVEYQESNARKLEESIEELGSTVEYQTTSVNDLITTIEEQKDELTEVKRLLEEKEENIHNLSAELQSTLNATHENKGEVALTLTSESSCQTEGSDVSRENTLSVSKSTNTDSEFDQKYEDNVKIAAKQSTSVGTNTDSIITEFIANSVEVEACQSMPDKGSLNEDANHSISKATDVVVGVSDTELNVSTTEIQEELPADASAIIDDLSLQLEKATASLARETEHSHSIEQQLKEITRQCQDLELKKHDAESDAKQTKVLLKQLQFDFNRMSHEKPLVEEQQSDGVLPEISERIAEKNKSLKELRENFEIVVTEKDQIIEQLRKRLTSANEYHRKEADEYLNKANELKSALHHAQQLNSSSSDRICDLENKLGLTQKRFERVLEENKLIGTSLIDEFQDISEGLRQDVHLAIQEKKDIESSLELDRLTLENQVAKLQENLHNTEFKFSHLKTTLSEKDMLIAELQDRVEAASDLLTRQQYYNGLESRTKAVESDLQTARVERDATNNALAGMRVTKEQLEHEYSQLTHQHEKLMRDHAAECDKLRMEKAEYCQELRSSFDNIIAEKDSIVNELRHRMQTLQHDDNTMVERHDADIESLKNEYAYQIEELQNRISDLISEKEVILKEKSNQAGLNKDFEQLLKEKDDVVDDRTSEINRLNLEINNKTTELYSISQQLSLLQAEIQSKDSQIEGLLSDKIALTTSNASAIEQAVIDKTNCLSELRNEYDQTLADERQLNSQLEEKIATLQSESTDLHVIVNDLKNEKAVMDQSLSDANLKLELLSAQKEATINENQAHVADIDKLKGLLIDWEEKCFNLQKRIDTMQSHSSMLASHIHSVLAAPEDVHTSSLESNITDVLQRLNQTKQELQEALNLRLELDICNSKIHELEQRNNSLITERLSIEKDLISVNIAKDNAVEIAREDLEFTLKSLRGDLERATSDNEHLQNEIFFMRQDTKSRKPHQFIDASTNTDSSAKIQIEEVLNKSIVKSVDESKPKIIEECIQQSSAVISESSPDVLISPTSTYNNNKLIFDVNQLHEELDKQKKIAAKLKSAARRYRQQFEEAEIKSRKEIDSLNDVCQRLRQENSDWHEQCNMKELNLKTMREEVDSLVQEKASLVERYRTEAEVMNVEYNNKTERLSQSFMAQIDELKQKLDYLNSQTADLENNLSFKESELSAISGTNTTQELQINELQHSLSLLNESCRETQAEFESEHQKRLSVEEKLHHASSELDELHHYLAQKTTADVGTDNAAFDYIDLSSRDEKMQDLINRLNLSQQNLNIAEGQLQRSGDRIAMLESEKLERERILHDLREEIGEIVQSKNETIELWNQKVHMAEATKQVEIKELTQNHEVQRSSYLDEMEEVQHKLTTTTDELLKSKSKIADLTSEIDELRSHIDAANTSYNAIQSQNQALITRQQEAQLSFSSFQNHANNQLREKDSSILSLKETVDRLSVEHAERQKSIESLQKTCSDENTALNRVKALLAREQERCKRLEADLMYATGRNRALEADSQLATENALSRVEESNQQLRLSAYKKDKQLQEDRVVIDQLMQEKEILSGQIRRLAAKTSATTDQSDGLIVPPVKDETLQMEISQLRLQIQSLAAEKDAVNQHHDNVVEEMIGELSSERRRSETLQSSQRLLQAKLFSVLKGFQSLLSDLKNSQADLKEDLLSKLDAAKQDLNFAWFEVKSKLPDMIVKSQELTSPQGDGMTRIDLFSPPRSPDSIVSSSAEARLYESEQQLLDSHQTINELQVALRSWKERCVDLEEQLQRYDARGSTHNRSNDLLISIDDDDDSPTIASARTGFGANVKRLVAYGASGIKSRTRSWTPLRVYSGGRSIVSTLSVIPAKKFLMILYMITLHTLALVALKCLI